ncbi:MAG: hypothetical protein NC924_09235 [Candidatus Omnitrophica bacterium]|nr:hypothetical protein [Candidatus Omnitrophota bacterium]
MHEQVIKYLQMFFHRKNLFLYPFVSVLFLIVVYSFVAPPVYISSTSILIEEQSRINPLISGLAISSSVAQRIHMIREQILGWDNITKLIQTMKLDSEVRSDVEYEELVKKIRDSIIVNFRSEHVVTISYQGREPQQVFEVAKTLKDLFVQKNQTAQTRESDIAVSFLRGQLLLYKRKIKEDEIKRLEEQLTDLMIDSTARHPMVKELNERIAKLKSELESGNIELDKKEPQVDQGRALLNALVAQELSRDAAAGPGQPLSEEMRRRIIELRGGQGTAAVAESTGLAADRTVNEQIYLNLLERLETARITRELDNFRGGTSFTVIDPPRLPLKPAKPDKIKLLLLGLVLAAGSGCGLIYLAEMMDLSYRTIHDAKADLPQIPLLGAISTIMLEDEFTRRQQGDRITYLIAGLFVLVMIAVVVLFSLNS